MKRHLPLYFICCMFIFASCVSQKKYQASLTREQALNAKNTELGNTIADLRNQISSLQTDNAKLVKQIDDALKQASTYSGEVNMTQKQLEAEQKRLWDLRKLLDQ